MRVSCLQENLARGLSIVGRAVASRSTALPVLSYILLSTDQGRLKLAATNLETSINCWIGAKVEEDGAITVPARTFIDFVNTLPPETVEMTLSVRTQTLQLTCGSTQANFKGIDAQEFPIIPEPEPDSQVLLDPEALAQMIRQVAFAAATDESRLMLTGVLTEFEGDQVTMVAADGFRLSLRSARLPQPVAEPVSILIPARALAELGRILADQEEPVQLTVTPSRGQVIFRLTNADLVSQLIDMQFPDYRRIIPTQYETRTVVNTEAFLQACKRASIFARDVANTAWLKIIPGGELQPGSLIVTARSDERGDNASEVVATVEGPEIEIAFNVRYLMDVLSVVETPEVVLETTNPRSPGVIRPVGEVEFLHVIMPMRVER